MKLYINGEAIDSPLDSLDKICLEYAEAPEYVATAVNGLFIPKSQRHTTILSEGDAIDIVAPLEGG